MQFTATTEINAAPETIWRIVTDAAKYPDWDPGIIRIEGAAQLRAESEEREVIGVTCLKLKRKGCALPVRFTFAPVPVMDAN